MKKTIGAVLLGMVATLGTVITASPASAAWTCTDKVVRTDIVRDGWGDRRLELMSKLGYTVCKSPTYADYWYPRYRQFGVEVLSGTERCRTNPVGVAVIEEYRFNLGTFGYFNPGDTAVACEGTNYNSTLVNFAQPADTTRFNEDTPGGTCFKSYIQEVVNNGEDDHWVSPEMCITP